MGMPDDKPVPGLPSSVSVYVQLGFAGIVAVMFPVLIYHADTRATEDRQMYREESRSNRDELKAQRVSLERAVDAMNAAVVRLDRNHQQLKQTVDVLKMDPAAFTAPPPREKP